MATKKPISIEVVEEPEGRFVVSTYADGSVERKPVDTDRKRSRRSFFPYRKLVDRTRKKQF